ncbi:MAG TPA: DUF4013 domain-containing protein, partial [Candidatus Sulfotelmatobacter sp.]
MEIFINRENQQYGPYTLEDVRNYVAQGLIVGTDLARSSAMPSPVTVASFLASAGHAPPPLSVAPAVALAGTAHAPKASAAPGHSEGNILTWPFHQDRWWESLWMPLLWWVPVFGTLISFGWTIAVIRRRAARQPELPRFADLGAVLKDGFVVAAMSVIYFAIPTLLFIFVVGYKLIALNLSLLSGGWLGFLFNPGQALLKIAEKGVLEYLLGAGIIPIV